MLRCERGECAIKEEPEWTNSEFMASLMGKSAWYSIPLSVLIGVPLYSNAAGIIPIVSVLIEKGASLGTALAFMMADMATEIDAARLLVYRAAYLKETGQRYSKEAAMAKMYASDVAMKVTVDAVQIFGGYGYIREYPVERLMRNAKITQIYEGTNQVQRMVISGAILR